MQISLGDVIADLCDLSGSAAEDAQIRALSTEAREWHAKGNKAMAQGAYAQAVRVWQASGSDPSFAGELEYTRQIISGDQSANADYQAGLQLVAQGKINSRPQDSSFFAQFSTSAPDGVGMSRGGFWEGLDQGVSNLKAGRWFFGKDPSTALSNAFGISPTTAKVGLVILGIGVAGYTLSQGNKLASMIPFLRRN